MKKAITLAVFAFGAALAFNATALAQGYTCEIIDGRKCYVYPDGSTVCDQGSTGEGTFESTTGPIPEKGPVKTELAVVDVTASIKDPKFGAITTTAVRNADTPPTTITSYSSDRYPLDVNINFYADATVESLPGVVFKSRTPLSFASKKVTSVNPFVKETLTLANDVEFYDEREPDKTVFTLQAKSTNVTLGSSNHLE